MALGNKFTQEINALELGFIIVCSAILKSMWMIYIDNLAYRVIGLNRESAYQTFIVAIIATTIVISFLFIFDSATAGFSQTPDKSDIHSLYNDELEKMKQLMN